MSDVIQHTYSHRIAGLGGCLTLQVDKWAPMSDAILLNIAGKTEFEQLDRAMSLG